MSGTPLAKLSRGVWSNDEHERFLEGLRLFPNGPWLAIAERVGTRSVRQVQTHALAYQERAARRLRDLRQEQERMLRSKDMIDQEMRAICQTLQQYRVPLSPQSASSHHGGSINQLTTATLSHFEHQPQDQGSTELQGMPTVDECLDFLIEALASSSAEYYSE